MEGGGEGGGDLGRFPGRRLKPPAPSPPKSRAAAGARRAAPGAGARRAAQPPRRGGTAGPEEVLPETWLRPDGWQKG